MNQGRIPSLNWLRVFEAAARLESFARAADELGLSPPAVSQQVRALEGHLRRDLFERGARHVRLTAAGKAFLPAVRQSLQSLETTTRALFGARGLEPVTVQAVSLFAASWLAPRIAGFQKRHPNVQLQLSSANRQEEFAKSGVDVQINFGSPPDFPEHAERILGEDLIPVASPDAAARIEDCKDMLKYRLIEIATHRSGWAQVLGKAGLGLPGGEQIMFVDSTPIALALAAAGPCIALARAPASDHLAASYGLVPALPGLKVPGTQAYYLILRSESAPRPEVRAFRDWLLSELAA